MSVYDAEHVTPEIAVTASGVNYRLISSKSCYVVYHILMYIISFIGALLRFESDDT